MLKQGVLLINLGSPDSAAVPDVRRYLREFLTDPRVIDVPYPVRFALVNGIIAPFRAAKSAEAYRKIWTGEGSPLISISQRLANRLQGQLGIHVGLAMRYGKPGIAATIEKLSIAGVRPLLVIPLFPHYAMSSYESAVVKVQELAKEVAPWLTLAVVPPYFNHPAYLDALVEVASPQLESRGPGEHLLFSFHGIPERHILKSDVSACHCLKVQNCCEKPAPSHEDLLPQAVYRDGDRLRSRQGRAGCRALIASRSSLGWVRTNGWSPRRRINLSAWLALECAS